MATELALDTADFAALDTLTPQQRPGPAVSACNPSDWPLLRPGTGFMLLSVRSRLAVAVIAG
jgi:hypothetical protein